MPRNQGRAMTWADAYDVMHQIEALTACMPKITIEHQTCWEAEYKTHWWVTVRLHSRYDVPNPYRRVSAGAAYEYRRGARSMIGAVMAALMAVHNHVQEVYTDANEQRPEAPPRLPGM